MNILFFVCIAFNFIFVASRTYHGDVSLSLANGITAILFPLAAFIVLAVIFKNQSTATIGGIFVSILTFIVAALWL